MNRQEPVRRLTFGLCRKEGSYRAENRIRKSECGMRKKEFGKVEKGKAHGAGSIEKSSEIGLRPIGACAYAPAGMWNAEKMN